MQTRAVTTKKRLMEALAEVMRLGSAEKEEWVSPANVPVEFDLLEHLHQMDCESDLPSAEDLCDDGFVIAPVFMIAVIDNEVKEVFFEDSVQAAEARLKSLNETIDKGRVHLLCFRRKRGFAEAPFDFLMSSWDVEYSRSVYGEGLQKEVYPSMSTRSALYKAIAKYYEMGSDCGITLINQHHKLSFEIDADGLAQKGVLGWDAEPWVLFSEKYRQYIRIYDQGIEAEEVL